MSLNSNALQRFRVETIALNTQNLLGEFASSFLGIGLSVLLGFDPIPSVKPFQTFWNDNKVGTFIILGVIAAIGVLSFFIAHRGKNPLPTKNQFIRVFRLLSQSTLGILIGFIAGLILGIGTAPSTVPLLAAIRDHPPIGIGIGALLIAILIVSPLIVGAEEEPSPQQELSHPHTRIWLASTTSFVSLSLLFTLFGLITLRPSWCPTTICPAPQFVIVTNPNGVNDGVMESYFLAQQSDAYVLSQDPSTYTFNNLPNSIGAVELGKTTSLYRAVIGIHSLQRNTRYGLIIDGVEVVIDKVAPIQSPVNVFLQGTNLNYNSNVFTFNYGNESVTATLPAKAPTYTVGLEVGGSDELTIQTTSRQEVYLQFHLQVQYHEIVGKVLSRTLIIPHEFAVEFIAPAHWEPYIFSGGQMTPQPSS